MKRLLLILPLVVAACEVGTTAPREHTASATSAASVKSGSCTSTGFDQYGYNRCARNFVGVFGGWCADYGVGWDCMGAAWSQPYAPLANDHLVMKWNAAWDACDGSTAKCAGAWTDNELNGMGPDGSKWTEHAKIVWIGGNCGADLTPLADGGYCIWGQYEAVMDQGMSPDGTRYVLAHVTPGGYGVPK